MPFPLVPLLIGGGTLLLQQLFGHKDNKQQGMPVQPGTPLYDWLTSGMMPGSGGGGGGSSTSTQNHSQTETRNLLNMPVIASEFQPLVNMARGTLEQRFRFPQGIPPGYEAQGIQTANRTFDALGKGLENKLYGMGAAGSPAGAYPTAVLEAGRGQTIADFRNRLPELARDWQNQDINLSGALTQMLGLGQRQTGTVKTTGTSTTTGSSGGGGGGGARFDPQGPLTWLQMQQQNQNQGGPNFFDQLVPLMMYMVGSGMFGGKSK